ncbi:MAG: hypothetical protein ACRDOU_05455, partial [Streptosporangiaceae bacterium]
MSGLRVKDAEDPAAKALVGVEDAERELAAGLTEIDVSELSRLRDEFRHAKLKAKGDAEKAARARTAARITALEQLGAEVDKVIAGSTIAELNKALQAIADLCGRVYALADAHDTTVAALVATAQDLGAEGVAPNGARATCAFVGLRGTSIVHRMAVLNPVGGKVLSALGAAQLGPARVDEALAMLRPTETLR